jgi:hypothetical protein
MRSSNEQGTLDRRKCRAEPDFFPVRTSESGAWITDIVIRVVDPDGGYRR